MTPKIIFIIYSCLIITKSYGQPKYTLQCNFKGAKGHTFYLMDFMGSKVNSENRPPIDSIVAPNDTFQFNGEFTNYNFYSLSVDSSTKYREFIIDTGKFNISGTTTNFREATVQGFHQNDLFEKLVTIKSPFVQKINSLSEENKSQDSIIGIYKNVLLDFTKQYPDCYASFVECFNLILAFSVEKDSTFAYTSYSLLTDNIKNTPDARYLSNLLKPYGLASLIGKQFPKIKVYDTFHITTNIMMENDFVYLIDYWTSWVEPYIAQPQLLNLTNLYYQYQDSGFKIISISLDTNFDTWIKATQKRDIPWPSYLVLQGTKGRNENYLSITTVPYTILVGKGNKIIKLNPTKEEIEKYLKRQLK